MSEFNHLNEIENKLNQRGTSSGLQPHENITNNNPEIKPKPPSDWDHVAVPKTTAQKHLNGAKKIFLGAIGILLLAFAYLAYTLVFNTNSVSSDNIIVDVITQSSVSAGEDLPLTIHIENKNKVALESVVLSLKYMENSSVKDSLKTENIDVGRIDQGQVFSKDIVLKLFGAKNDISNISITLEYRLKNESAIYSKVIDKSVTIANTPVVISFNGPKTVSPDNEVDFKVSIKSFSEQPLKDTVIISELPNGFVFKSSVPSPSFGNNIYAIGDLLNGQEKQIEIKGTLSGVSGELKAFNFTVGQRDISDNQKVSNLYSKDSYTVLLENAFLNVDMSIGGQSQKNYYLGQGDLVKVDLNYQNNLNVSISNVRLAVKLDGGIFESGTVNAYGGLFDDSKNELSWSKDDYVGLAAIEPGESGRLQFEFKLKNNISGKDMLTITPSTQGYINSQGKVSVSSAPIYIGIKGIIQLLPQVLYATGPITNSGPIPPTKGQKTSYTIKWAVVGNGDNFSDVVVYATLPSTVEWEDSVSNSAVKFDPIKRIVTWTINNVTSTNKNLEAYFKISITPVSSQVGKQSILVNSSVLDGTNTKTNENVSISKGALRTGNVSDSGFLSINGIIVE